MTPLSTNKESPSHHGVDVDSYIRACQSVSGPKANPRAKVIFDSLTKHLLQFAAETDLTLKEWTDACNLLVESGKMSDDRRNEMILISDVLGLESLLDTLAHARCVGNPSNGIEATASAILGPFYRENPPKYANGDDIVQDHSLVDDKGKPGVTAYIHGSVKDTDGNIIPGAEIDVWHTAPNGFYEQQDPKQPDYNNRGVFTTDSEGHYAFRCLQPTPYPIPFDGGSGVILKLLDRHPMRPAHIHLWVRAQGHHDLITQIFDAKCPYLGKDAVFADNKSSLSVEFVAPFTANGKASGAQLELEWDIVIAKV